MPDVAHGNFHGSIGVGRRKWKDPPRRVRTNQYTPLALIPTMSTEEEVDPYELIGIKLEATDQEIKTAYRQKSLKVHPDRVCRLLLPC